MPGYGGAENRLGGQQSSREGEFDSPRLAVFGKKEGRGGSQKITITGVAWPGYRRKADCGVLFKIMEQTLNADLVEVKIVRQSAGQGVFAIGPLPTGFGQTIGNTLRRVLLSSLPGAALSQVRFDGVPHQFSTIKGVKEDVVELTLNLKKVRLKIEGDQPAALTISAKGPGEVKAGDIKAPAGVTIVNTEAHLATLADGKTELKAELIAEPGRGYRGIEGGSSKVGVIPLDCLFSPVTHVSYQVSPARVGRSDEWETLEIEITSDRTITPFQSLVEASGILAPFFGRVSLGKKAKLEEVKEEARPLESKKAESPIEELELPLRLLNTLKKAKVTTIGSLLEKGDADLLKIKNVGTVSVKEIKKALKKEVSK